MKNYRVKCNKNSKNLNSKTFKTKNDRLIMQSKCADCEIKKSRPLKKTRNKRFIE